MGAFLGKPEREKEAKMSEVESTKPVFTASELLTIHEMAAMFDKSKPGYVEVKDLEPIKEKVQGWVSRVSDGKLVLR
jgi:hypothetical protein